MENNLDNQVNKQSEGIFYQGEVVVKTMKGNKVIHTYKDHNNGTPNLFNFFANCLWGIQAASEASRPCKVVLFAEQNTQNETDTDASPEGYTTAGWTESYAASIPVFYDRTPTGKGSLAPTDIRDDNGVVIGKEVTLHFRIPFLYLLNNAKICKIGLFPNDIRYPDATVTTGVKDYGSMLAYYKLTTGTEWNSIEVPANAANFTIVVDWTMKITNVAQSK